MGGKMSPITHVGCRQSLIRTRQFQLRDCGVMQEDGLVLSADSGSQAGSVLPPCKEAAVQRRGGKMQEMQFLPYGSCN